MDNKVKETVKKVNQMIQNRNKNCTGCYIHNSCKDHKNSEICPCIKCLVKVTCGTGCIEYDQFELKHRTEREEQYLALLNYKGKVMSR
jgi:hypothetical protein